MEFLRSYLEKYAFGVSAKLGEKLKIPTTSIQLFFIYSSFLTFGSPVILYLVLAFIMNVRKLLRRRNNTLWYY